ncbi:MAG: hypothetical protein H0U21_02180 [Acidimicrobiia bacterium]|nr:hypothetical protein [Acidimicrobiia bacterium]
MLGVLDNAGGELVTAAERHTLDMFGDPPAADDSEPGDTGEHLDAVLGEVRGHLFVGFGSDQRVTASGKVEHGTWNERSFRWPTQRTEIVEAVRHGVVSGADVYFTPSLSENPVRKLSASVPGRKEATRKPLPVSALWADLDGEPHPGRIRQLVNGGAWRVASGSAPDRHHLYVPLVEPAEPDVATDLLGRLAAYLAADPAVARHGAYLRPAGTLNRKPDTLGVGPPGSVHLVDQLCEARWTVDTLDDLLPPVEHAAANLAAIPTPEDVPDVNDPLAEAIAEKVTDGMDRSKRSYRVTGMCVDAGFTDGQVLTLMRQHEPTSAKFGARLDIEVARAVTKIRNAKPNTPTAPERKVTDTASTDDGPIDDEAALPDGFHATDVGNASRLVAAADGRIRHVHGWQKWITYSDDDGVWILDTGEALVTEKAKQVPRRLLRLAADLTGKQREAVWRFALRSEQASSLANMLRLARGVPGVLVDHHALDADPWSLNTLNGTVNLRSGTLRPHDPDDLLTMQAPVMYDPAAPAPLWDACVRRWQPDADVRGFLQRAIGSAATGHPVENLFVNVGTGANGKSKFFGAIAAVLGPFSVIPHKSLLVAGRHEGHPTHVASLFRARMLVAPETSQDDRLDEEQVKNLTGGDTLRARRMREDEWSFEPSWTAFMHTNHRPRVRGIDEGIWRRVRLISWDVTIPASERDEHLASKLAAEASGILNWVVAGAVDWSQRGLDEPDSVRLATEDYRRGEDHLGKFLADTIDTSDEAEYVTARDLRTAYEAWCADAGETAWSPQRLGRDLAARGFDTGRVGSERRCWLGMRLR